MRLFDGWFDLAEHVVECMREGLAVHDRSGRLIGWNPAAAAITGWTPDEAAGLGIDALPEGVVELASGRWVDVRHRELRRHGRRYTITLFTDAADRVALQDAELLLSELGTVDPLTALPSRTAGQERLSQALALARREYFHVGLLYIDLDGFKKVNETIGQEGGDEVLRLVAQRLKQHARESDTAARFGGDEFAVILTSLAAPEDAETTAERFLEELSRPYIAGGREIDVRASIGVTVFPKDGFEADILLRNAEAAMEKAKVAGGNGCRSLGAKPHLRLIPGLAAGQ